MAEPFGGMKIDFKNRKETLESIFGEEDISPSEVFKKLWAFVKSRELIKK